MRGFSGLPFPEPLFFLALSFAFDEVLLKESSPFSFVFDIGFISYVIEEFHD